MCCGKQTHRSFLLSMAMHPGHCLVPFVQVSLILPAKQFAKHTRPTLWILLLTSSDALVHCDTTKPLTLILRCIPLWDWGGVITWKWKTVTSHVQRTDTHTDGWCNELLTVTTLSILPSSPPQSNTHPLPNKLESFFKHHEHDSFVWCEWLSMVKCYWAMG